MHANVTYRVIAKIDTGPFASEVEEARIRVRDGDWVVESGEAGEKE
jgi:hypothetical protein